MSQVRVLLTNDDGIEAPGLAALERVLAEEKHVQVWTAAPDRERSTCSHGMSLIRPLMVRRLAEQRIATDGFPSDCVYFALFGWMPERPHVVISGINRGANLGTDVIYSGTVAGAREASIRGIPAVATSLVSGEDYEAAARHTVRIALELVRAGTKDPLLLNLNFPAGEFTGPQIGVLGERHYPEVVEPRQIPVSKQNYYWLGGPPVGDRLVPGTDGWLVSQGIASLSALTLDQTSNQGNETARGLIGKLADSTAR